MARKDWRGPSSSSTIKRVPRGRVGAIRRLGGKKASDGRESGIVTYSYRATGKVRAGLEFCPTPIEVPHPVPGRRPTIWVRSEEHTSDLQSLRHLVCRLLLEKKKY